MKWIQMKLYLIKVEFWGLLSACNRMWVDCLARLTFYFEPTDRKQLILIAVDLTVSELPLLAGCMEESRPLRERGGSLWLDRTLFTATLMDWEKNCAQEAYWRACWTGVEPVLLYLDQEHIGVSWRGEERRHKTPQQTCTLFQIFLILCSAYIQPALCR